MFLRIQPVTLQFLWLVHQSLQSLISTPPKLSPFTKSSGHHSHVSIVLQWNYCAILLRESGTEKAKIAYSQECPFHSLFLLENDSKRNVFLFSRSQLSKFSQWSKLALWSFTSLYALIIMSKYLFVPCVSKGKSSNCLQFSLKLTKPTENMGGGSLFRLLLVAWGFPKIRSFCLTTVEVENLL